MPKPAIASISVNPEGCDVLEVKAPTVPKLASSSFLARNATLNLITEGWIFLVLIAAMPKLVSFLGERSFGLFSLAWVVIGYLSFLDIGVNRAATKFISEHLVGSNDDSVRLLVRTAFIVNLLLGLIGALVVALTSSYFIHSTFKVSHSLEGQARLTFYAVALAVPVLLVQGILRAVLSSYQRFGWINGVNAIAVTVQWSIAVFFASKGYGVALVVLSTVVTRLFAVVAYSILLSRLLPKIHLFRITSLSGLSKLLRFGSWVSVSQIISPVLVYLDRMLIASFVSLGAVTLYTVPYEMMTRLRIIPSSLVTTLYPAFSERGSEGQQIQLQMLYERSVRYLLLLLVPGIVFLVILGPDVLTIWMGNLFASRTARVLQVLALGVLANGISYVPYNMLQGLGRPDLTGKFHLLELPPYILLCLFLIPHWGVEGAAIASTIRFAVDFILLFWAANKFCQCTVVSFWTRSFRKILLLSCVLALVLVVVKFGVIDIWMRLALGILTVIGYVPACWVLIVDDAEKPRISRVFKMLLRQGAL